MKLTFNIDDIRYLKMTSKDCNGNDLTLRLAFKEKKELEIIAVVPNSENCVAIDTPQKISLDIICEDGLYRTDTILKSVQSNEEFTYYTIENPSAIDYIQNREFFRIYAEYDCIYTVNTEYGPESYNAVTYDISAGGVSIILDENILSREDASLMIMLDTHNIKSHTKFIRSELYGDDSYKLSFEFTDLSERDMNILEQLCVDKQLGTAYSEKE